MTYEAYAESVIIDVPWRSFGLPTSGHVLDVGSGPGWTEAALSSRGLQVVNLDIERLARRMVLGNARSMPFRNGSFDGVVCLRTLQHIPHHVAALSEFARVLRADGFLLLGVGNHWTYTLASARAHARDPAALFASSRKARYYHLYTRTELGYLLRSTGFIPVAMRTCHFLPSIVASRLAAGGQRAVAALEEAVGQNRFATPLGSIIIAYAKRG